MKKFIILSVPFAVSSKNEETGKKNEAIFFYGP